MERTYLLRLLLNCLTTLRFSCGFVEFLHKNNEIESILSQLLSQPTLLSPATWSGFCQEVLVLFSNFYQLQVTETQVFDISNPFAAVLGENLLHGRVVN